MSKFKPGDRVKCYREESEHWHGFDFIGIVMTIFSEDEYVVSNTTGSYNPPLIWEEEMSLIH